MPAGVMAGEAGLFKARRVEVRSGTAGVARLAEAGTGFARQESLGMPRFGMARQA